MKNWEIENRFNDKETLFYDESKRTIELCVNDTSKRSWEFVEGWWTNMSSIYYDEVESNGIE